MKACVDVRCGAFFSSLPLSLNASKTNLIFPCCKYLTPPCTNFVDLLEVPFAKSYCSINKVL